jgi:hypothetical protein
MKRDERGFTRRDLLPGEPAAGLFLEAHGRKRRTQNRCAATCRRIFGPTTISISRPPTPAAVDTFRNAKEALNEIGEFNQLAMTCIRNARFQSDDAAPFEGCSASLLLHLA